MKLILSDVSNLSGDETTAISTLNLNSDALETALENTLSRDGTSPNQMNSDLDLNSNNLLNGGSASFDSLTVNGIDIAVDGIGQGPAGDRGWSPVFAIINNSTARVLQLVSYVGGTGSAPTQYINYYVGISGMVSAIGSAIDIRGPAGVGSGDMTAAVYDPAAVAQQVVGTAATQTLTNKSLTAPIITGTSVAPTQTVGDNSTKIATTAYVDKTAKQYINQPAYTGNLTLVLTDAGNLLSLSSSSTFNVTIPPNSSVAFPINTRIDLVNINSGQVTFVAGAGVTLNSKSSALKTNGQYTACSLIKLNTDTWILIGDITT